MVSRTLRRQEIEDLLIGARIMGTGGGGEVEWARPLIREVYEQKKEFRLIDPRDLPDSELVVIVSRIGGGISREQADKVAPLKIIVQKPEQLAFRLFGEYLGREPFAVLPTELGAGNTLAAMCTAALLDKPTVDADCMGRAKPQLQISTTNICGVPVTPVCLVTHFGDVMYLDRAVNDSRAEDILRSLAAASGGIAGLCRCPMEGRVARSSTIHNTISLCIRIGGAVREANKRRRNPVDQILKVVDGTRIFEGEVSSFEREERGAFMWGKIDISGAGDYSGHTHRVWFKNEHLISWLDGKPYVTCPDTILILDANTGEGLSNWGSDFSKGRRVVTLGLKANRLFRTKKGLEVFTPKAFGYDIAYVPIERVLHRKSM